MYLYPEKGATAMRFGVVLAVGASSLALAGSSPGAAEKKQTKHVGRNQLMVDHIAEIAMLSHTLPVIIKAEEREEKKLKYNISSTSPSHSSTRPAHISYALAEWEANLRFCESRDNYHEDDGNGYYGAYQFSQSTWNSTAAKSGHANLVGMLPSDASKEDQDEMIVINTHMASEGLEYQNPGCYNNPKYHLSEFPPK